MESEDASNYTDKISNLEKQKIDFLKLSKKQITTVKVNLKVNKFHFNGCIQK
jgi:hypothetical protein